MSGQNPQAVDVLITADFLITMDAERRVLRPGAVVVRGDSIVAVGTPDELAAAYLPAERVDCGRAVIMPGLVNTHGHAPMALLRGLADDLRLDVWLMGYMMPVEREFVTPHFSWLGTQLAAAEMIRCGTTTFMDMYYFEDAVADAAALAGLRAVCAASASRPRTRVVMMRPCRQRAITSCAGAITRSSSPPLPRMRPTPLRLT